MKRLICICLSLLLCLGGFAGCGRGASHSSTFYLMDTLIGVTLYIDRKAEAQEIFGECEALLSELEALWDRRDTESEAARFNASESGVDGLDARTVALLKTALAVSAATDGAFDVTVTPLVEMWALCEREDRLPREDELAVALSAVHYQAISLSENGVLKDDGRVAIDLGGIGKGAAISALIGYLETTDARGGLVSFGSNVAVFGEKPDGNPFRVAIKHPREANRSLGTLTMPAGTVLSVSGDYERYVTIQGKRYHHILDPANGYPADTGLSSVAVLAKDGALADALSTALLVMGEDSAMALYESGVLEFEAIFADAAGGVRYTDGLDGIFVLEET